MSSSATSGGRVAKANKEVLASDQINLLAEYELADEFSEIKDVDAETMDVDDEDEDDE